MMVRLPAQALTTAHALVYDLYGSRTYSGAVSGSGSLTKIGNGSLTLTGSDTYSGKTTVSGGTLAITNSAVVQGTNSLTADSGGAMTLAGNALLSTTGTEYVGNSGIGTFVQSGGTNNIGNILHVGYNAGSSGTYTLASGMLAMTNTTMYTNYGQPGGPCEYVGYSGTGNFVQSAGTNSVCNDLVLGYNVGSSGMYALTGGTLALTNVNNDSSEYIGFNGNGTFTQTGGLNTMCNELNVGYYSGSAYI